jgi:ABC-type transport system involved in cytochrome c biogenesis permease subunit
VTAFFGSYLTISGGVIVFDKFPEASPKKKTINENIINYLPFIVGLLSLAILGMFVQMKHLKEKQQLELEQQGLDKMKQ